MQCLLATARISYYHNRCFPPTAPPVCTMTPRALHLLAVVLAAAAVAARKYEILGQLESSTPDQVRQNPAS